VLNETSSHRVFSCSAGSCYPRCSGERSVAGEMGGVGVAHKGTYTERLLLICEDQALVVVSWVIHTHDLVGSPVNLLCEKKSNVTF
jgi:hypothetical protein